MQKDKKPQIAGSLERGGIYTNSFAAVVYTAFVLMLFAAVMLALYSAAIDNVLFLYTAAVPLVIGALLGYFVFADLSKRLYISKCLKDGVRLKARCEKVMDTAPSPIKNKNANIKIAVIFEYKGKTKRILSGKEGYSGRGSVEKAGFADINVNYANRDIEIIYSPATGGVLLFRESQAPRRKDRKK